MFPVGGTQQNQYSSQAGRDNLPNTNENNMTTTSQDPNQHVGQHLKILDFWHKVEFFIPFDLQYVLDHKDIKNLSVNKV